MPDPLIPRGTRTPLTPALIKQLATITPAQLNESLTDMLTRNPALASLMLAQPIEPPKPKGKRRARP